MRASQIVSRILFDDLRIVGGVKLYHWLSQIVMCGFVFLLLPRGIEASTILILLTRSEVIIASDGLSTRVEGGSRHVCKIVQVGNAVFFAAVGSGKFDEPAFDPYLLARQIGHSASAPSEAAAQYGERALVPLQEIWIRSRAVFLRRRLRGPDSPLGPQDYVFVGRNSSGHLAVAGGSFIETDSHSKDLKVELSNELVALEMSDVFLGKYGVYQDIPDEASFVELIAGLGAAAALRRAIEIQSKSTPALVGGPITILVIRKDGSHHWICRGACP